MQCNSRVSRCLPKLLDHPVSAQHEPSGNLIHGELVFTTHVCRLSNKGRWVLDKADECRRLAQQCLIAARGTNKMDVRAALLQRAQLWLELAQWQEEQERQEGLAPASSANEPTQPPIQQQQQVQPKTNKKPS